MIDPAKLNNRLGKVLRYLNTYTTGSHFATHSDGVLPEMLVVNHRWSDLPHTRAQARMTLEELRKQGLATRTPEGYKPTELGRDVEKRGNADNLWSSRGR